MVVAGGEDGTGLSGCTPDYPAARGSCVWGPRRQTATTDGAATLLGRSAQGRRDCWHALYWQDQMLLNVFVWQTESDGDMSRQ
jgi:hypothetical protein